MRSHTEEAISGTQSIERAFAILREVKAAAPGSVTVAVLAKKAQLNRTTTHRIVSCLVDEGALRRDSETGHIVLGPFARDLGIGATESLNVSAVIAPVLTRIAEKTGDTAFLMIRNGNDSVCVDRRWGSYPIKTLVVEVGTRRPLGIGAGSVAMLAAISPEEYHQVFRDNTRALKSYNMTAEVLRRAVAFARANGYASTRVQAVAGVRAIGVPLTDADNTVVGAISMAAIDARMTPKRQRELKTIIVAEVRDALSRS